MRISSLILILTFILISPNPSLPVESRSWITDSFRDFEEGEFENTSLKWEGEVVLGRKIKDVCKLTEDEVWDMVPLVSDGKLKGVFISAGSDGNVYKCLQGKDTSVFFHADEPYIYSLSKDEKGDLFAASSPDGGVYRISSAGEANLFFDPQDKYIWDLAVDKDGRLYVSTGQRGRIYRVTSDGNGKLFYDTKQDHATSIIVDYKDEKGLLAGTSGKALIVRLSSRGKPFILADAGKGEVRDIVTLKDGTIYAAVWGEGRTAIEPMDVKTSQNKKTIHTDSKGNAEYPPLPVTFGEPKPSLPGGINRIIKIDPEGFFEGIWQGSARPFSLGVSSRGHLIVGTGDEGVLYRYRKKGMDILYQFQSDQIVRLYPFSRGTIGLLAGTGKCVLLEEDFYEKGDYISKVFDAEVISSWGAVHWMGDLCIGCRISIDARCGNLATPDETWSDWIPTEGKAYFDLPKARFFQYRARLKGKDRGSPTLRAVRMTYMEKNLSPHIEYIRAAPLFKAKEFPVGPQMPKTKGETSTSQEPPMGPQFPHNQPISPKAKRFRKWHYIIWWSASDINGDVLVYNLWFKGKEDPEWMELGRDIREAFYYWDTRTVPDGQYRLRLIASDSPSNVSDGFLKSEVFSSPIIIDNTPPIIENLKSERKGNVVIVSFEAHDRTSILRNAYSSLDGELWRSILSIDGIPDSRHERFRFELGDLSPEEHVIMVRVEDDRGNTTTRSSRFTTK